MTGPSKPTNRFALSRNAEMHIVLIIFLLFSWRNDEKPGSRLAWHAWLCSGDISGSRFRVVWGWSRSSRAVMGHPCCTRRHIIPLFCQECLEKSKQDACNVVIRLVSAHSFIAQLPNWEQVTIPAECHGDETPFTSDKTLLINDLAKSAKLLTYVA